MKKILTSILIGSTLALSPQFASAQEEITVGYFLEWPMPMMASKASGEYDDKLGVKVNWRSFETGTAMSAAMASGDVQISVSQGLPPFVVATSAGQDIQIVDIAVSYSDNDGCVVSSELEIDKDSASELAGKKVAVPMGTAAHYGFLRQMSHFGIDISTLDIVNMPPPEGAVALSQGAVDFACGYGGGLTRMKEHGNVLLTGAEKEELGILVFDVTSVTAEFASENEEMLSAFLAVTAAANTKWNENPNDEMLAVIAKESGQDLEAARAAIATMAFPAVGDQLGPKWMGGGVQTFMKGVADVFVEAKSIDAALPSYEAAVNTAPLEAANTM